MPKENGASAPNDDARLESVAASQGERTHPDGVKDEDKFSRIGRVTPMQAKPQGRFDALVENQSGKPSSWDEDSRTFTGVLTTDAPVRRWFGDEVLRISADAIDLERVSIGQVRLLDSHNAYQLGSKLGTIERVWIEGGKLMGVVRVDDSEAGNAVLTHIKNGIGISIGYRVLKWKLTEIDEENDREVWTGVKWELLEASLVSVPADRNAMVRSVGPASSGPEPGSSAISATIGRHDMPVTDDNVAGSQRGDNATATTSAQPAQAQAANDNRHADNDNGRTAEAVEQARREAIELERKRTTEITQLATRHNRRELGEQHVAAGTDIEKFRTLLLDDLAKQAPTDSRTIRDEREVKRNAAINAQMVRGNVSGVKLHDAAREHGLINLRLVDLARECLSWAGESTRNMSEPQIIERALHSTSDFPYILENISNQTLLSAYQQAPETFRQWTRQISLPDFRSMNFLRLDGGGALRKVNEHGEFKRGTVSESKEAVVLTTFGEVFGVTRQTLVNDNLGALTQIPTLLGRRAATTEGDVVYRILLSNQAMVNDGKALFHVDHANLAGTAKAIDADEIGKGRLAMAKQTGLDGKSVLNIVPSFLLIPPDLEMNAAKILATFAPTETAKVVPEFIRSLKPISEPRLSIGLAKTDGYAAAVGSATAYYLIAANTLIETIVYAYLSGESGPYTDSRVGFDVDGIEMKIRHDFGAAPVDFRGFWKNAGS